MPRSAPAWSRARDLVLGAFQGPTIVFTGIALLAAIYFLDQLTIWLQPQPYVHSTMRLLSDRALVPNTVPGAHGCGTYSGGERVGRYVGTSVQIAAGFCWNGRNVRWMWGLHRQDCTPIGATGVRVDMTCQISGGHNGPMNLMYIAQVESSTLPFVQRTVILNVTVTTDGKILQSFSP